VALAGFADAANASATVDLIWIDVSQTDSSGNPICLLPENRNCPPDPRSYLGGSTIASVGFSEEITLGVILTAGPNGSIGAGVSVNYGDALPVLGVVGFQSLTTTSPRVYFPFNLGSTTDWPPYIDNINAASLPVGGYGIGLPPGVSAYLGTVSFHKDFLANGSFEISVGTDGPNRTDGVLDGAGNVISDTTTFNSAFLLDTDNPPPCSFEIEINTLRAGGKTISTGPGHTADVTAKARIRKGTAASGTTIDTWLTIQARDGAARIGANSAGPITLDLGKRGNGVKLPVEVPQCNSGSIAFLAAFRGTDSSGGFCEAFRTLFKDCR